MSLSISDALFDFALALRLESPGLREGDPDAALELLPSNAGLPLNSVAAWPKPAQAGLLQLLEVWFHVDAIAAEKGLALGYPDGLAARSRPTKLGPGLVGWLRRAGPSLAPMTRDLGALRDWRRSAASPDDEEVVYEAPRRRWAR